MTAAARIIRPPGYERLWSPQYRADGSPGPQVALVTCPIPEILFGGARGGGKTDGALGCWLIHANRYGEHAKGIFFRRRFKQLEEVQARCMSLFPKVGARFEKSTATWHFPNGATLKLRHLWDDQAAESFQGHQYTFMVFEEATNWPFPDPIDKVKSGALRSPHGVPVKVIYTANPGGAGHNWCKERFSIGEFPGGYVTTYDPESGTARVFIPSRLEDNPALMLNDPSYERRLLASGNSALVKAWRFGDWNIVAGGFFDDIFDHDKHLIKPFPLPRTWTYRRSFDWGSAKPSSLDIWAVSDGTPVKEMKGFVFPRGSLIRVAEGYTVAHDRYGRMIPNVGLRLTNRALGQGIAEYSKGKAFSGCVADPSIFSELGRESIYVDIQKGAKSAGHNLIFNKADNDRAQGWQRMRDMLEAAAEDYPEKPGLWSFETCKHFARTIPVMQRDEKKPDDLDTEQEDHIADSTRYACMTGVRKMRQAVLKGH